MTLSEAWCRTYTSLVPEQEAGRRQAEVASHVHEARAHGVSVLRLTAETVVGAVADLVWSDRARRRAGGAPLLVAPLLDASVGAIVAGAIVVLALGLSMLPGEPFGPHDPTAWMALGIALSGHVVALVRRVRGSRSRRGR
ncbi:MAG: hypothetical protein Q8R60_16440 [Mycobacteriales bacterium]|nr:hypothetical protein [Mycobacteriales bacterium]